MIFIFNKKTILLCVIFSASLMGRVFAMERGIYTTPEIPDRKPSLYDGGIFDLYSEDKHNISDLLHYKVPGVEQISTSKVNRENISKESDLKKSSYAVGVTLGKQVKTLQNEKKTTGVKVNNDFVLAGLIDGYINDIHLTDAEINQLMFNLEKLMFNNKSVLILKQKRLGAKYLHDFMKDKRSRKSESGFWYRVDYVGKGEISRNNTVDIVVTERLIDGAIISDMEKTGQIITTKINNLPKIFSESINYIENHGQITIVSPPELAYGDIGVPDKIPPGAFVIYTLRISDVR